MPAKKAAATKRASRSKRAQGDLEFLDEEPEAVVPSRNDNAYWEGVKVALQGKPGTWAKVKVYATSRGSAAAKASTITRGNSKLFPAKDFEVKHSLTEDKQGSILFLKYNPQI